jgi:hypothetical protein
MTQAVLTAQRLPNILNSIFQGLSFSLSVSTIYFGQHTKSLCVPHNWLPIYQVEKNATLNNK